MVSVVLFQNGLVIMSIRWSLWVCLSLDFVTRIFECFQKYVKNEQHNFFLNQSAVKKLNLLEDIEKGGRECFRAVRDEPTPPLATITWNNTIPIPKIRWAKSGHKNLPYHKEHKVDPNFPIVFSRGSPVTLSESALVLLNWTNLWHLRIVMKISLPKKSQVLTFLMCIAASFVSGVNCGIEIQPMTHPRVGQKLAEFVSSLQDCPTCPFQELNESVWVDSLKGVKKIDSKRCRWLLHQRLHLDSGWAFVVVDPNLAAHRKWESMATTVDPSKSRRPE